MKVKYLSICKEKALIAVNYISYQILGLIARHILQGRGFSQLLPRRRHLHGRQEPVPVEGQIPADVAGFCLGIEVAPGRGFGRFASGGK